MRLPRCVATLLGFLLFLQLGAGAFAQDDRANSAALMKTLPSAWSIGRVPLPSGLSKPQNGAQARVSPLDLTLGKRRLSSLQLIDATGHPIPYRTQYMPVWFLKHVGAYLRAKGSVPLFDAPEGAVGATPAFTIDPGTTVRIIEAYAVVDQPFLTTAQTNAALIVPSFRNSQSPQPRVLKVLKGTKLVVIEGTLNDMCGVFFSAAFGMRPLCFPEDGNSNAFQSQVGKARTSFLVQTVEGRIGWTQHFGDQIENRELNADWLTCDYFEQSGGKRFRCGD